MYAIKVEKSKAQIIIETLQMEGVFDPSRKIEGACEHVWIPVTKKIKGAVEKELKLRQKLPGLGKKFDIHSFDIIGEIAIVFIPDAQRNKRVEIGEHILKLKKQYRL